MNNEFDQRYSRGKIYTIRNRLDNNKVYVGSTIETLRQRWSKHRHDCKYYPNRTNFYKYINNNDWSDWEIKLYQEYPCRNKKELEKKEYEIIGSFGDNALNKKRIFHE